MDPQTNHQFNNRALPKRERRVRFADSMGLELASIFLFDLISNYYIASIHKQLPPPPPKPIPRPTAPIISSSSIITRTTTLTANKPTTLTTTATTAATTNSITTLTPKPAIITYTCQFSQPISLISFKERVKMTKVHLETCKVNSRAGDVSISCTIRVLNQSYDKSVIVRYTTDEWHTFRDSPADYGPGSCDGWSDKFTTTFTVSDQVKQFRTGQRIIFAIRYVSGGDIYWDNNGGLNYSIQRTSGV